MADLNHDQAWEQCFGKAPPVYAWFFYDAEKDIKASEEQGAPVYIEKVMVTLQVSGDRDRITYEATPEHKKRFAREWAYFQEHSTAPVIPLEALPQMRAPIRRALNELGIKSVDDLLNADPPGYLAKWKTYALQVKAVHDRAAGIPKPHVKLVAA